MVGRQIHAVSEEALEKARLIGVEQRFQINVLWIRSPLEKEVDEIPSSVAESLVEGTSMLLVRIVRVYQQQQHQSIVTGL